MTEGQIPAGWYPDPAGDISLIRYWDGQAWTAQTQPMVQESQRISINAQMDALQPVYAPGQAIPVYQNVQPTEGHKGLAVAGFVLGIMSVVLFCLVWIDTIIGLVAVVLSAIGIKSSRKGMAIIGLVLGIIGAVVSMAFMIAVISDPTIIGLPSDYFSAYF